MRNLIKRLINIISAYENYFKFKKKVLRILKTQEYMSIEKTLDKTLLSEHLNIWKKTKAVKVNSYWFKLYSFVSGIQSANYIPENVYYSEVEPRLNNHIFSISSTDKSLYSRYKILSNYYIGLVLTNRDGSFYDSNDSFVSLITDEKLFDILNTYEKLIIKPTIDSGGGKGIKIALKVCGTWKVDNELLSISYLNGYFKENFIIQEYIKQHHFFRTFNNTSLNTIRVFTYRSVIDNRVHVLHNILRVGKKGSYVDNQAAGGVSCKIRENGTLNSFCIDKFGNKSTVINSVALENQKVPFIEEIKQIAIKIAQEFYYSRALGFDFCVNEKNEIKIIEVNNKNNEINFFQMNGDALFREHTEEIINYCSKTSKSFSFDFKI